MERAFRTHESQSQWPTPMITALWESKAGYTARPFLNLFPFKETERKRHAIIQACSNEKD